VPARLSRRGLRHPGIHIAAQSNKSLLPNRESRDGTHAAAVDLQARWTRSSRDRERRAIDRGFAVIEAAVEALQLVPGTRRAMARGVVGFGRSKTRCTRCVDTTLTVVEE
jgi:hypothetical protein